MRRRNGSTPEDELDLQHSPGVAEKERIEKRRNGSAPVHVAGEPTSDAPKILSTLGRETLVGRERELAALSAQALEALAGRGSIAFVEGEPGIGKTRLVQEACRSARCLGMRVLSASCNPAASAVPYEPLSQVLSEWVASPEGGTLEEVEASYPALLKILPASQRLFRRPPSTPRMAPEHEAYRRGEELAAFFVDQARLSPVLIVLEDLQWCDRETLACLPQLGCKLGTSGCLLVGTYREDDIVDDHPLSNVLAELMRSQVAVQLHLGPLQEKETVSLLRCLVGEEPNSALAAKIHIRSDGNPFFIREIAKDLLDRGDGEWLTERSSLAAELVEIPETVRLTVLQRLGQLSTECRAVVEAAAVVGRDVDLDLLLAVLADEDEDGVTSLLDEAIKRRILTLAVKDVSAVKYTFVHELFRDVVYHRISPVRRARLHQRVAYALEESASMAPDRPGVICYHLEQAGRQADRTKLVRYLVEAGERAMEVSAFETAVAFLCRAAGNCQQGDAPATPAYIARQLGGALVAVGDVPAALERYDSALSLMEGSVEADSRAELRLEVATHLWWLGREVEALRQLELSLEECSDRTSALAATLHLRLGCCLLQTSRAEEGSRWIEQGASLAESLGASGLRSQAAMARAASLAIVGDHSGAARQCEVAAELALDAGVLQVPLMLDRDTLGTGFLERVPAGDRRSAAATALQLELGFWLVEVIGNCDAASRLLEPSISMAESLGDVTLRGYAKWVQATWLAVQGDAASAASEYEAAASLYLDCNDLYSAARALHEASACHFELAHLDEGRACSTHALQFAERCGALQITAEAHSMLAMVHLMLGDWDQALLAHLEEGRGATQRLGRFPMRTVFLTSVGWHLRLWRDDAIALKDLETEIRNAKLPQAAWEPGRWLMLAKVLVMQGDVTGASNILKLVSGVMPTEPPTGVLGTAWPVAASFLVSCLCDVGDAKGAMDWYDRLAPYGKLMEPHTLPALELGRVASLNRRWTEAKSWLSAVHKLARQAGARPFAGLAMYELGQLYQRRNGRGDLLRARRCFRDAFKLFDELGMRWHCDEAVLRLKEMERRGSPITVREADVLQLWADGKTYAEIGKHLRIETKTVATHIQDFKEKLRYKKGLGTKADIIAWARREGVIS